MNLFQDAHFRLLESLLQHNVKFIIIGGHAAIFHGVRRSTADLDILIEPSAANGERVVNSLKDLGLDGSEIEPQEFESRLVLSFGLEPDAVDINYTPGIDFEKAFNNSEEIDFSGIKLRVIDLRDLIANKESLQRQGEKALLDQYDAGVLKKILQQKASGK